MKKIFKKALSVFLATLMLFTATPAIIAMAAEDTATPAAPIISLEIISETADEVTVAVMLKENSLKCLDLTVASGENLILKEIDVNLLFNISSSNIENGMISIATLNSFVAENEIAKYTYEKLTAAGITSKDFSVIITGCGVEFEGNDVDVTDSTVFETAIPDVHEHKAAGDWFVTEPSTCDKAGTQVRYCEICNEIAETSEVALADHINKTTDRKDATCTEDGYEKVTCNDCGKTVSETVIPSNGHSEDTTLDRKLPTCTEDGYVRYICNECGEIASETIIPTEGHNHIVDTQLASCTEDGYIREVCTACGDEKSNTVLYHSGHEWLDWEIVTQPTYSKEGVERRICDNCGIDEERSVEKLIAKPTQLILSQQEIGINFRGTTRLFATVYPEEAAYSTDIIWESSDESIVTVDETGAVYAVALGSATITARTADGSLSATCEVTVSYSFLQWIIVYILFGWIWYL